MKRRSFPLNLMPLANSSWLGERTRPACWGRNYSSPAKPKHPGRRENGIPNHSLMQPLHPFLSIVCAAFLLAGSSALHAQTADTQPTVIESEKLDMRSTDTLTTFVFSNRVIVTGTNLRLTCDKLEVVTTRQGDVTATIGKLGNFKSLIATGNVRLIQSDREAACGRAEVLPDDDKIILTDNPVVKDLSTGATASGPRMVLFRGERRAVIEGGEANPSRIILPAIKDLGFGKDKKAPDAPAPEKKP